MYSKSKKPLSYSVCLYFFSDNFTISVPEWYIGEEAPKWVLHFFGCIWILSSLSIDALQRWAVCGTCRTSCILTFIRHVSLFWLGQATYYSCMVMAKSPMYSDKFNSKSHQGINDRNRNDPPQIIETSNKSIPFVMRYYVVEWPIGKIEIHGNVTTLHTSSSVTSISNRVMKHHALFGIIQ